MQTKLICYVMIRRGNEALLTRYAEAPNPRRDNPEHWWIPSPELEVGEHPEDAAGKVLVSLGITDAQPKLAGVDSFTTRDWHVCFHYVVDLPIGAALKPDARYAEAKFFAKDALPDGKAFAHGAWERKLAETLNGHA